MTTAQNNAPAYDEQASGMTDHPTEPAAAGIAETVSRVLAKAAAAASPSRPGDIAEFEAITDAVIRLLLGTPLCCDGQLAVKSLAEEAGLKRNKLTHKHTGLKDLFYALVRLQDARPKVTDNLKQKNDELKQKLSRPAHRARPTAHGLSAAGAGRTRPGSRKPAVTQDGRQRQRRPGAAPLAPAFDSLTVPSAPSGRRRRTRIANEVPALRRSARCWFSRLGACAGTRPASLTARERRCDLRAQRVGPRPGR